MDNIIAGNLLGKQTLAAMGLFSPVITMVGCSYVIIMGVQVLCANYIGACKKKAVQTLFFSAFVTLAVIGGAFSIVCFFCRSSLSVLLGAKGEVCILLKRYMAGYVPGIVPQILSALSMSVLSYNNDIRRSYWSAGVMVVANTLGDLLLSGSMGIFGIGLASDNQQPRGFCGAAARPSEKGQGAVPGSIPDGSEAGPAGGQARSAELHVYSRPDRKKLSDEL